MDKVLLLEKKLQPFGKVVLLGAGRLGIRVFEKLIMVHRGGFKILEVFDGACVEGNDTYHLLKGSVLGENKASFLERVFINNDKTIISRPKFFSDEDFESLKNSKVVISTIAGGNTLNLISKVANFCVKNKIHFITTNGVFGFGNESIKIFKSLNKVTEGPALFLKEEKDFPSDSSLITFIGTGKLIKDGLPITSTNLEKIAEAISVEALKILYLEKNREDK
ncbi:MAG: ThiF family adenylyltransferase [Desulfurobacteriaceae bacterium]